jgi:hypothetical protein
MRLGTPGRHSTKVKMTTFLVPMAIICEWPVRQDATVPSTGVLFDIPRNCTIRCLLGPSEDKESFNGLRFPPALAMTTRKVTLFENSCHRLIALSNTLLAGCRSFYYSNRVTSVPGQREAPRNEKIHGYFDFKR